MNVACVSHPGLPGGIVEHEPDIAADSGAGVPEGRAAEVHVHLLGASVPVHPEPDGRGPHLRVAQERHLHPYRLIRQLSSDSPLLRHINLAAR